MTKETKIGLLVGLTFIIIVGILLGDTVRNASNGPVADLPKVAENVRTGVITPGNPAQPPISLQGQDGLHNATPQQTVPTHEEITRPQTGIVYVGPGELTPSHLMANSHKGNGNDTIHVDDGHPESTRPNNRRTSNDPLHQLALQNGEELEPVGGQGNANPTRPNQTGGNPLPLGKTYQAGPGDSLGKIAVKFYGSGSKPYRDAIVNVNPSLKANPDRIIAGQTYNIPALETTSTVPPTAPIPASRGGNGTPTATPVEYYYTVKENDSLWRIARDQVGDPKAVATLKELNRDVLNGSETVRINMKIRLPGKPVAN